MYEPEFAVETLLSGLEQRCGSVAYRCGPIEFGFTDYYAPEMGGGLRKLYLVFNPLFDRERLPDVKLATNALEEDNAKGGARRVNIDPGYLSRDKLALASTKDFYHRLYLGRGVFGEVTLHYRQGALHSFPWTYPDYQVPDVQQMLLQARADLVGRLRKR